jgi:Na+/melibiose symporter-like transporter
MNLINQKLKLTEKIGYALGDGAADIAWRGVSPFLFIVYTDVFGLNPAAGVCCCSLPALATGSAMC